MNLEELADDAKKENIIAIAASLSKVDGSVDALELIYLLKLGFSMGVSDERVREIMSLENPKMHVPASEQERMTIFYYLVFLIKADKRIDPREEELLHHYGLKLGFNHLMIENVIRILKKNAAVKLDPNVLLNEIKKYLN